MTTESGDETLGGKSPKIPYDKLAQVAKSFKLKSKRLEREVEVLKEQLFAVSSLGMAGKMEDYVDAASGGSGDVRREESRPQKLFWMDIIRASPFEQKLARSGIHRFIESLKLLGRTGLVEVKGSMAGSMLRGALYRWKHCVVYLRLQSMDRINADQQKVIKDLELKHAKLKLLLSRTRNASKQQIEDSNASKRAQSAAMEELKGKEQEKAG